MDIFYIVAAVMVIALFFYGARILGALNICAKEMNSIRLLQQKMAEKAGVSKDDIDFAIGKK